MAADRVPFTAAPREITVSKYWFSTTVFRHRHRNRPTDNHRPSPNTPALICAREKAGDEEENRRMREMRSAGRNWIHVFNNFNRPDTMNCLRYLPNINKNNNNSILAS